MTAALISFGDDGVELHLVQVLAGGFTRQLVVLQV